jgi:hypothetical protein
MEHVIILLLIILLISIGFANTEMSPESSTRKIIPIADIQFSEQNFPSVVYEDIFNGPNVWQGGYNLDQGRPVAKTQRRGEQASPPTPSGYVKSG